MRPHQDSILAMRVSAALMSVSAALLVIMLLTGDAQAKAVTKAQEKLLEEQQVVVSVNTQVMPTATAPSLQALTTKATTAVRASVALTKTATTKRKATSSAAADLPAMPVLGTIAEVPTINIQPRPAPAAAAAAPAPQPKPKVVTKTS